MKIGLDASWAIYEKAGIGQYTSNLVQSLLQNDSQNEYVLFFNFYSRRQERMAQVKKLIARSQAPVEIAISHLPVFLQERLTLWPIPLKTFYNKQVDIFHTPFFGGIAQKGFPQTVVTIHDLAFMKFPEHHGAKLTKYYLKRTKLALDNAQNVIAVSSATKRDLIDLLAVDPLKIKVIYEGVNQDFKVFPKTKVSRAVKKYLPGNQKYILSVCTLEPRKNLIRLVKAYSLLPYQLRQNFKLVLIGQKGWNNRELFQTIYNLNLKESVILPGYVTGADLPYLYNGASLFVYPSLYEGFGLPPLEAMACGLPVIASNTSAMPEVVGKAGLFINPYKEEEIALMMKRVLFSPKLSEILAKRSLAQAKKFSWEKTARETIKVYQEIYRQNMLKSN